MVHIDPVTFTVRPSPASTPVTTRAAGLFDVKINPLDAYNRAEGASLGRMSIDKEFHGDLEAKSQGEMLTAMG
ncbi:MAG: DUF3224 domain-containing protein, partial [Gemmatimonadales bacterium]